MTDKLIGSARGILPKSLLSTSKSKCLGVLVFRLRGCGI